MKLYGALLSPFVRKVAVFAAEKGLAFDLLVPNGEEFAAASPFGKMPAIDDGGFTLADSTAIALYLDAQYPSPALIPGEAKARGTVVWFDEFADTIYAGSGLKILFNRLVAPKLMKLPYDEAVAQQGEAELPRILNYLEGVVPSDGWLVGEFSLADISVSSMLKSLAYVGYGPDAANYPRTAALYDRVKARPSWQSIAALEAPLADRMGVTV